MYKNVHCSAIWNSKTCKQSKRPSVSALLNYRASRQQNPIIPSKIQDVDLFMPHKDFSLLNPPTLLVGMEVGTATMENSMEVPQKTKNQINI